MSMVREMRKLRGIVFLFLVFFPLLLRPVLSHAQPQQPRARLPRFEIPKEKEAQWQITANKMSYLEKEGLYVAEGDVVVTRAGQVLHAQKAIYNEQTGLIEVSGDVRFETNGDYLIGDRAIFDLHNRTGQITKAKLFMRENHFYVSGDSMEKLGADTYVVKSARLTSCDAETAPWSITASEVKVTVGGYGVVREGTFRIRDVPALYLPYMVFPAKTKRQSGLLMPEFGYSNRNGADTELPVYWAFADQADATFYERYMSKRGLMQGVESRYVAEENSKGALNFDFLQDKIGEKDLSDPDQAGLSPFPRTDRNRYWFRGKADQAVPGGVQARLDADYVSDQDYLREFSGGLWGYKGRPNLVRQFGRPMDDNLSPLRASRLRLSRDQSSYSLQARGSYYERPERPSSNDTPEPVGGAMYSLLPRPILGNPLFLRLRSDYDYIWRQTGDKGQRIFLGPEITHPFWLGRYMEFEPTISYMRVNQFFERGDGTTDQEARDAYDMQARFSTLVERTYDMNWGETKRLKHKIVPSIIYRYREYDDASRFRPWFEPTDVEGKRNLVALSLENFFDARNENQKGEVSYRQWGTFQLIQGYDIEGTNLDQVPLRELLPLTELATLPEKKHLEPLVGIVTYHPHPNLEFDSDLRWDTEQGRMRLVDTFLEYSLKRFGERYDHYGLEYLYIPNRNESVGANVHVNLTEAFAAGASVHQNLNLNNTVGARYYMQYYSQCWGVRLSFDSLLGIDTVMVTFTLLGLGEFGPRF